jgi:hypothetical protein
LSSTRILVATDLPFWRGSNGAEQRILSLVTALSNAGKQVHVFCITPPGQRTEQDLELIKTYQLSVEFRSSDQVPRRLAAKLAWYRSAAWNQFGRLGDLQSDQANGSQMSLAEFRWPWAIEAFRETIDRFRPDVVLIEYIKLAYLLEAIKPTDSVCKMVDTHDVLHRRAQQFSQRNHGHWIQITESEEAAALQGFDVIVAIEPGEANWFRQVTPEAQVIVCPHAPH